MKKTLRRTKGITLIALVITIIVLLILAGVSIAMLTGENGILTQAKNAKEATAEAEKQEKKDLAQLEDYLNSQADSKYNESKGVNSPKLNGLIPIKWKDGSWVICSEDDTEWYDYSESEMKWANAMAQDGNFDASAPVGTKVEESQLGSMFVWIPRFAYSIKEYHTANNNGEGTKQEITDVEFLIGTTDVGAKTGTQYSKDYDATTINTGNETPKITHPAFKLGDKELTGLWIGKFEASMKETNNNTTGNNNVGQGKTVKVLPNKESWRYIQVGNCFKNVYNMRENAEYGFTSGIDTHLMRNSEWGAVAYLSASQYGKVPTMNNIYESYQEDSTTKYHAYTGGGKTAGDYITNKSQSTTGNETGIYDMNGGAWEYVAAYWDNENSNLSYYGTDEYFKGNKINEKYSKYWEKYEVSENEKEQMKGGLWNKDNTFNNERKKIAEERYNLMKNVKGDAMYEVINTYSYYGKKTDGNYEWLMDLTASSAQYGRAYYNNDYVLIGNCSLPFLRRGGGWWGSTSAGVFASYGSYGVPNDDGRFPSRVVGVAL